MPYFPTSKKPFSGSRTPPEDALSVLYNNCSPDEAETVMAHLAALGDAEYEIGVENLRAIAQDQFSLGHALARAGRP
jgi:hypothetical protein